LFALLSTDCMQSHASCLLFSTARVLNILKQIPSNFTVCKHKQVYADYFLYFLLIFSAVKLCNALKN